MIVAQIHRIVQIYVAGPVVEPQAFNAAMKETLYRIYGGKAIACWLTVLKYDMVRRQLFITTSSFLDYHSADKWGAFIKRHSEGPGALPAPLLQRSLALVMHFLYPTDTTLGNIR